MNELEDLVRTAQAAFVASSTANDLENAKAQFLGKSGRITELMKGMAALSVEEKKTRGAAINAAKQAIEGALNERRQALVDAELQKANVEYAEKRRSGRLGQCCAWAMTAA